MKTSEVPSAALRFTVGVCAFAAGDRAKPGQVAAPRKVTLTARSGQPIEHWYWGNVVHDLAGMTLHKPTLPVDYCHDCDQVLGYLDTFDITSGDLLVSGEIVPFTAVDRASEVLFKSDAQVPYEASINFAGDGIRVQQVAPGEVTQVNGYAFEGPGIVIREWPLRGVAICPYGADANTAAEFSSSAESPTVKVTLFSEENPMSKATAAPAAVVVAAAVAAAAATPAPEKPATELAAAPVAAAPAPVVVAPATPAPVAAAAGAHAPFVAAFGDQGATWFLEGKSFEASAAEFIAAQKTSHAAEFTALKATHAAEVEALKAKVTALSGQIEAAGMGNKPVVVQGEQQQEAAAVARFANALPPNLAKVAAATVMPGDRNKKQ